ncbi:MAG: thioredoxin domain-containing protein, partial [Bacteroidota bacterium]|nr:thioredoxin domain-containing protein [Bacteroidota bacterium]
RGDNTFYHTWKNNTPKHFAFLDDYSYLIAALIELAQCTTNYAYLYKAKAITEEVLKGFADLESPFFFYTHVAQTDILLRKKEIYDGATPSGNAVMAINLYLLSIIFDQPEWRERAEKMLLALGEVSIKYPTSFGVWLALLFQMVNGTNEIAVVGEESNGFLTKILKTYMPHKVIMASSNGLEEFPLLQDKVVAPSKTLIYLCKNYACRQPVSSFEELKEQLNLNNF